jgi:hypothetical protein
VDGEYFPGDGGNPQLENRLCVLIFLEASATMCPIQHLFPPNCTVVLNSNMKKTLLVAVCALLSMAFIGGLSAQAQTRHAATTNYPSFKGLIMAGYQGWFRAPASGVMHPNEAQIRIDMWPDVSEYEVTYPTGLKHADGSTARFFSSTDKSTVDLHFRWMREYGLDGVFMQRFFSNTLATTDEARENNTIVLRHALAAASENNRAIAVMYDLSGLRRRVTGSTQVQARNPNVGTDVSSIIEDWKYLVDHVGVTNQPGTKTYLHHNGKPVVAIWGVGFPDRPYNIRDIGLERLIDFLQNDPVYGGCAVMLGVPTFWRDLNADCVNDPYLHDLIRSADIVMPWTVQRFSPLLHNDMDRFRDLIIGDIRWTRENGVDYIPVVTPGFSWYNLSRFEFPEDVKPVGSIPRMGGRFFWQQLTTAMSAGADMIYVAMFDEVNEGTAIFKISDDPPVSDVAKFVGNDGRPSDWYLWLTGEAAKMLRKEKPLSFTMPERE